MRNIKILFLLSIPFIILTVLPSCGGSIYDDNNTDLIYGGRFGYYSKYNGASNQAYKGTHARSEEIARELVNAINLSNKIYLYAVEMMIPEFYVDNYTNTEDYYFQGNRKIDNGTCTPTKGTREYYTIQKSMNGYDNLTKKDYIDFMNYCHVNMYSPVERKVIINSRGYLDQNYTETNLLTSIYSKFYSQNADNITVSIQNSTNLWDNFTMTGLVERTKQKQAGGYNYTKNITKISMDMPDNPTMYRFDFTADEGSTTTSPKKTIDFYHRDYGYVTADISFLGNNEELTDKQIIVMYFNSASSGDNNTCVFYPAKIGSGNFDCTHWSEDHYVNY